MEMLKKAGMLLLSAVVSNYAYADIIELDALNPDHCRQQILNSKSEMPVIALYASDAHDGSAAFMENFEALAAKHPEQDFYKWDAKQDALHITQSLCLQQIGLPVIPSMMMVGVFKEDTNGAFMTQPFRSTFTLMLTLQDLEEFIGVSDVALKQLVRAQKASRK